MKVSRTEANRKIYVIALHYFVIFAVKSILG